MLLAGFGVPAIRIARTLTVSAALTQAQNKVSAVTEPLGTPSSTKELSVSFPPLPPLVVACCALRNELIVGIAKVKTPVVLISLTTLLVAASEGEANIIRVDVGC